jgi:hypothetical protein
MKTSLKKQRNKFQNTNKQNITDIEKSYITLDHFGLESKSKCKEIKKEYKRTCTSSDILSKVREFYVNDWYENTTNRIDEVMDMKSLKEMKSELYKFKELLNIKEDIQLHVELNVEKLVKRCIEKRIAYKHYCVDYPDESHDAEILRQVFYHERLKELKRLFIKIQDRFIAVKEMQMERRRLEDETRRAEDLQEIEYLKLTSSESSDTFIPVVSKKQKHRSRSKK